jgi:putative two-component system response regulator
MPRMSGIELLGKIRDRYPEVAVVMVTGLDDRSTATAALTKGAYDYIIKPFEENELVIRVTGALERQRAAVLRKRYEQELERKVEERTRDLRRAQEEIIFRLLRASGLRDEETGAHVWRMGRYAAALAEALGWPPQAVTDIRLAAPMHDVGKIGIPDRVLGKRARLTDSEFGEVQDHALIGAEILAGSGIPLIEMAHDIALYHQEKWDGSGYPEGLAGKAIPEAARIVAIADVYDALLNKRCYRPAKSEEEALRIMRAERGTHFDPEVLDCFLRILPKFREIRLAFADEEPPAE